MKKLLTATALAVMLAIGAASPAFALKIESEDLPDGGHVEKVYDDDDNWLGSHFYDENNKHTLSVYPESDPNPEGGDSGVGPTKSDIQDALQQLLQNGGGEYQAEVEFFETWIGKLLIEHGTGGSIVPYHNPSDSLSYDPEGGYGGGNGGIDLMGGSIMDQVKKNGTSGQGDDDDDGDDNPPPRNHGEEFPGPPELVNPVPIFHDQVDRLLGVEPTPWVPGADAAAYPDIPNLQSLAVTLRPRATALQPMATQALRSAATARIAK